MEQYKNLLLNNTIEEQQNINEYVSIVIENNKQNLANDLSVYLKDN